MEWFVRKKGDVDTEWNFLVVSAISSHISLVVNNTDEKVIKILHIEWRMNVKWKAPLILSGTPVLFRSSYCKFNSRQQHRQKEVIKILHIESRMYVKYIR